MFFNKRLISELGYKTVEDFVADYMKRYKNYCVQYATDGVYFAYDLDTNDEVNNIGYFVF